MPLFLLHADAHRASDRASGCAIPRCTRTTLHTYRRRGSCDARFTTRRRAKGICNNAIPCGDAWFDAPDNAPVSMPDTAQNHLWQARETSALSLMVTLWPEPKPCQYL
jgi:hypothetical protein